MAIGAIELATVARTQDYTTIKQNEDNKVIIDQSNIGNTVKQTNDQKAHTVNTKEDTQLNNGSFDARDKGSNEYSGDGGKNRKKPVDKMVVKGKSGFDMKI